MSEIIFDIEADGLLDTISKVWVIAATDAEGTRQWIFTDEYLEKYTKDGGLEDGVRFLLKHDKKICHNIMGYDWHVLHKFWPKLWNLKTAKFKTCWDTLVQSKCQHYDRPRLKGTKSQHGLEYYGLAFGYPKPPIEDWTYFDEEKMHRVLVDIEINRRTYAYLNKEAERTGLDFETQIRRTQATQYWYTLQELHGTYGNTEKMRYYVNDLDRQIAQLRDQVEPYLPPVVKSPSPKVTWEEVRDYWDDFYRRVPRTKYDEKDKPIKKARKPVIKITKADGEYTNVICKWFDIPQCPDFCDGYVAGPFTKVQFVPSKMSQHAVVKDYLLKNGWKPTQWNYQKNADGSMAKDHNNKPIKKSPKLTEDSFDSIKGDIGQKIAKYNTLVHRRRTILNEKDDEKGWLNQIRPDGRIPAGAMAWATGTGRAAQFGIVNVPSSAATYGAPMREVWEAPEGKILVSVDMDSAQMRLLANFMGDDDYTKAVMEGEEFDEQGNYLGTDAHTLNAIAFGTLDEELVERARETQDKELIHECSKIRKTGKNGFYCVPMDTQALTKEGWKHYDDIREGDTVLGYNEETGMQEWTTVRSKVKFDDAEVYEFGHNSLKLRATADHRWFVKQRVGRNSMKTSVRQVRRTSELNSESNIIMNAPFDTSQDTTPSKIDGIKQEKWCGGWTQRVLDMSHQERVAFLEGFMIADGYKVGDTWAWSQNDGDLFDAALTASYLVHDGVIQVSRRKPYEHVIKRAKLCKKSHRGFATGTKKAVGKQPVFCITTDLGSWVMRQNDTITITGNCLLFGGGDVKLANTLKVKGGAKKGKQLKESFKRKLRKADDLQKRLVKQWKENPFRGGGYIQVAGDTWVWCPSEHKLLNYLLMGSEAVLQNEAICWVNPQIKRRKLQGAQLLSIHDELTFEFVLQQEKEAVKLLSEMYGVASEKLGLDVLVTGTAQSGKNWLEIH